ncbi:unnamed protein product [Cyberlindnera jadinii]|uniref:Uncharacterized protein n=1 Tax=Cyberlindnera jadinii (strain ATCC 18201 / CBS 1600 / BCRC 20928 / JCM 3617 / NBRC 0987 / NRRL Y-1542) TaxID=983966 RepID=A0A0H5C2Z6_CYBJN|nr:hypothetical protein CYBJADRAFT_165954 [Cyberlindnera jadinii NRRL Y-1542]ODV75197.1 hypothetical protein CYBJADRAFT_165954 [Cyberlindnera jadinii NRRL Y-1542]CEP22360.1 unnamed protein product [Cyberlindnera jadinii]
MAILKRLSITSGLLVCGGYFYLHRQLEQQYPNIRSYELPGQSRIAPLLKKSLPAPGEPYFAYCDTFKQTVVTKLTKEQLTEHILETPALKQLDSQGSSLGTFTGEVLPSKVNRNSESTLLKWRWSNESIVGFFETLAQYGYPWRMMNGGVHEILVISTGSDGDSNVYDVYFASAHEYKYLRDGKFIPRWTQTLHRDYGRVILNLSTKNV